MRTCENCIKWIQKTEARNGVYGKCIKNGFWCNKDYGCILRNEKGSSYDKQISDDFA